MMARFTVALCVIVGMFFGGPAGATEEAPGLDPVAGGHDDEEPARGLRRQRGVERDLEAETRATLARLDGDGGEDRDE